MIPLKQINDFIIENNKEINEWLDKNYGKIVKPVTTSIDLRVSHFKIAPVDTNLFPAGYNNFTEHEIEKAVPILEKYLKVNFQDTNKILIIGENFTRNQKYFLSIKVLQTIFSKAGFQTKVGSTTLDESLYNSEIDLKIDTLNRDGNTLSTEDGWTSDIIILNNDLTDGIPESLQGLEQAIIPSLNLGWHMRSKFKHFEAYNKVLDNFCNTFNFDPWFFSTINEYCGCIDFKNKKGLQCLADSADKIIKKVKEKYIQYNLSEEPYIVVKADRGTYGMGVMMIRDPEEILNINKTFRHSMNVIKSGVPNTKVMIQEGVVTSETHNGCVSESLSYMLGGEVIEIFDRWHESKDKYSNLNSKGMHFSKSTSFLKELKILISQFASIATCFE